MSESVGKDCRLWSRMHFLKQLSGINCETIFCYHFIGMDSLAKPSSSESDKEENMSLSILKGPHYKARP